jgi:hypothetical protein
MFTKSKDQTKNPCNHQVDDANAIKQFSELERDKIECLPSI